MSTTTLADSARRDLSGFGGELIGPSDPGYDTARAVYNAMIDRSPSLIARCTSTADVARAVDFARDRGALLAVRGGGHNGGGLGTCDDGVVIDLAPMKDVVIDEARRTVRVGGGATWADVDSRTGPLGLATPSGIIATTGVGGLTLGGGIGYISRRYGLTIDSLLSAEVVLPDGSTVRASADENADLLWALRGGGGNFGVVTEFEFRLHPVPSVFAGPTFWALDDMPEVMRWYREFLPAQPREVNGWFATLTVPPVPLFPEELHLRKVCAVMWTVLGTQEEVDRHLAPVHTVGTPLLHGVGQMPWADLQGLFAPLYPPGQQWYWRADFLREVPDEAIAAALPLRRAAPDAVLDDAHVPHRRCRPRRRTRRQRVPLPGRELGRGDRRRRSRSGRCGRDPEVDGRLLGRHPPVLRGWRLRELHDGGGAGARARHVRRQLPPADARQGEVRPVQPAPREPEHPARRPVS